MEIIGYQTRVKILQVLPCKNESLILDPEKEYYHTIDSSWLCDPFGVNITYGARFSINTGFSWEFFICVKSSEMAKELGESLLFYLQDKFKGLDGEISVSPLYSEYLEIERPLYEISLPIFFDYSKYHLIRKLINYYKSPHRKIGLNMFILWKKDDLDTLPDPKNYRIKIFVSLSSNKENYTKSNVQNPSLSAVLRYIISDLRI